jgi:hypothetical protein
VVNAVGNILDEKGEAIAGSKDPQSGKRLSITGAKWRKNLYFASLVLQIVFLSGHLAINFY